MKQEAKDADVKGTIPVVLTFEYTEKLQGQMLAYVTSEDKVEEEVVATYREFIPDFTLLEAQVVTEKEAEAIKAQSQQKQRLQ